MAERTFRSPGVFEREVEITRTSENISGTPAGVIGTAHLGPAFVPVNLGSIEEFKRIFGKLSSDKFGPYAVEAFLKNRNALSYVRVLGAGANLTSTDVQKTELVGTVKNAGFRLSGSLPEANKAPSGEVRDVGAVQFIAGIHEIQSNESAGYPIFTNNISAGHAGSTTTQLIRGMVLMASGARLEIMSENELNQAVLQYIWDKEVGDFDKWEIDNIEEL